MISSGAFWNLDQLKERIWEELGIARVYTKKKGQFPDFDDPVVMTEQRGTSPSLLRTHAETKKKETKKAAELSESNRTRLYLSAGVR